MHLYLEYFIAINFSTGHFLFDDHNNNGYMVSSSSI